MIITRHYDQELNLNLKDPNAALLYAILLEQPEAFEIALKNGAKIQGVVMAGFVDPKPVNICLILGLFGASMVWVEKALSHAHKQPLGEYERSRLNQEVLGRVLEGAHPQSWVSQILSAEPGSKKSRSALVAGVMEKIFEIHDHQRATDPSKPCWFPSLSYLRHNDLDIKILMSPFFKFNPYDNLGLFFKGIIERDKLSPEVLHHFLKKGGHRIDVQEMVRFLSEKKQFDQLKIFNQSLWPYAILSGAVNETKLEGQLITLDPSQPLPPEATEASYPYGWTPLAALLDQKNWHLAGKLVERGAVLSSLIRDPEVTKVPVPLVALMSFKNNLEALKFIVSKGTDLKNLDQAYRHQKHGLVHPVVAAALEGQEDLVNFLLAMPVKADVFSSAQLKTIAEKFPHIRQKLGKEGFLERFSRQVTNLTHRFNSTSIVKKDVDSPGSAGHLTGSDTSSQKAVSSNERAKDPKASVLGLTRIKQRLHQLDLSDQRKTECLRICDQAEALSPFGALPAVGDDVSTLERMWTVNVPLLIDRLQGIPLEYRDQTIESGEPTALQLFMQSMAASSSAMELMKGRALLKAHRQLSVEAVVMHDQAKVTLDRFSELIDQNEQKVQTPNQSIKDTQISEVIPTRPLIK